MEILGDWEGVQRKHHVYWISLNTWWYFKDERWTQTHWPVGFHRSLLWWEAVQERLLDIFASPSFLVQKNNCWLSFMGFWIISLVILILLWMLCRLSFVIVYSLAKIKHFPCYGRFVSVLKDVEGKNQGIATEFPNHFQFPWDFWQTLARSYR